MSKVKELINKVEELIREIKNEAAGNMKTVNTQVQLSNLQPGERFDTELGKFIVLDHDMEHGWTKVIQDNFYEKDVKFDEDSCNYITSELKKKFEGEITEKFQTVFGDALVEHEVELRSVDMQYYGAFECKVRPITFDEARQYNHLITKKELPGWWWTCTPWSTKERGWEYSVAVVSPSGNVNCGNYDHHLGVRPFCILKSSLFVSKNVEE